MTWRMVIDPCVGGYVSGFEPAHAYEFMRVGGEEVARFRLADQSPHFNVANLMFRPLPSDLVIEVDIAAPN